MLLLFRRLLARSKLPTGLSRILSVQKQLPSVSVRDMSISGTTTNAFQLARSESPLTEVPEEFIEPEPVPESKPKRRIRKAAVKADIAIAVENDDLEDIVVNPKRQRRKRKEVAERDFEEKEDDAEEDEKPKRRRIRKAAVTAETVAEDGNGEEKPKKSRKRKTPEEDKVFDIPPIENVLSTTFKGRLGYACLNTMLRKYSTPIFCSRTCRLATIAEHGMDHVRSLGLQNIRDLNTLVKWNAQNGIFFMRMSSEMFPFASHPEHGYDLSFADEDLKIAGQTARELEVRLTSHPGQFTQLGGPREAVVRNAVRDLEYHCEMMDRMGLDQDSVMIIHMGGTYNDKAATLERFKENYTKLLSNGIKKRLVLENDELCYNVDDLFPICRELNIPLVFDYHHDWIYPSSRPPAELIPEINQLWYNKGIKPKQHCSEPRPGAVSVMERRAHSDRVKMLPENLPDDMDLMLECKDKEQAVFYLYRLYGLRDVDPRMLRPPAEVESLHTNGRKSNKRARAKAAKAEAAAQSQGGEDMEVDVAEAVANGEVADAEEDNENVGIEAKIEREAEAHGVPLQEVKTLAVSGVELDCGSGDEAPEVEVLSPAGKKARGQKKGKRGPNMRMGFERDMGQESGSFGIEGTGDVRLRKAKGGRKRKQEKGALEATPV